jgi:hypothetical protein
MLEIAGTACQRRPSSANQPNSGWDSGTSSTARSGSSNRRTPSAGVSIATGSTSKASPLPRQPRSRIDSVKRTDRGSPVTPPLTSR